MKKLFIGLLIVAAGAAIFFLLRESNKPESVKNLYREQVIGQWKLNTVVFSVGSNENVVPGIGGMVDSNLKKYHYYFTKNGSIKFTMGDSLVKDSSHYEWNNENQMTWKDRPSDTSGDIFRISFLANDTLALQSKDSGVFMFTRVK